MIEIVQTARTSDGLLGVKRDAITNRQVGPEAAVVELVDLDAKSPDGLVDVLRGPDGS